ncbi:thiolase family protein [Fictibacillus gelatini]|uniref:thiolase family protein n=1 Tax=Fictibacillus gelatini TaxID=225985 RepID=UPI0004251A2E|nr:thiolase family protein [Fictibacillus gelatini]
MSAVYMIDGARTAFGSFGKSLKDVATAELGVITAKEAMKRSGVDPQEIGEVVYGNVIHSSRNAPYVARHIALKSGVPIQTPALLVNRLCGSGLQAVISAAITLQHEDAQVALCGGVENMSMSPHVTFNSRFHTQKFGSLQLEDMLLNTLTDEYLGSGMGITAENLARKYEITREEQDEYALLSHKRAAAAIKSGRLSEEIIPVVIGKEGQEFSRDELVKEDTTLEKLAALKPSFEKGGTVTAGNSSGINDGAVSIILAEERKMKEKKIKPLAKIVSWAVSGVEPSIMGIGPVPAATRALEKAGLSINDIDYVEVNEAFASQYLAVEKELKLNREKTNVNGGAISLGHPVGASGARILLSLAYELRHKGARYGLASLCIGGGQGIAMIIENVGD